MWGSEALDSLASKGVEGSHSGLVSLPDRQSVLVHYETMQSVISESIFN